MKTTIIIIAVIILGGFGFWAMTNYQTDEATTNSSSTTVTNTPTAKNTNTDTLAPATNTQNDSTVETAGTTVEVSVDSSGFTPSSVTISSGDTVIWINEDGTMHYVAPNNHPSHTKYADSWPDDGSGRIGGGQTYSYTFDTAGTYDYHDHLLPSKTGSIIVQ